MLKHLFIWQKNRIWQSPSCSNNQIIGLAPRNDIAVTKIIATAATPAERKTLLLGGIFCGLALAPASICQQWGLIYTSAGKTGFLTALYIIIVPLAVIFFRRKTSPALWGAVLLALAGTYLLCGGIGNIGKGECFVISAIYFSKLIPTMASKGILTPVDITICCLFINTLQVVVHKPVDGS